MDLRRAVVTAGATLGTGAIIGLLGAGAADARAAAPVLSIHAAPSAVAGHSDANPLQAGYQGTAHADATLSGTVVIPSLTCTKKDTNDVVLDWFIQGDSPSDDFMESGGEIFLSCTGGDTLYNVSDNSGDGSDATSVSPGDVITFSDATTPTSESITYTDETTGATATDSGAGISGEDVLVLTQGLYDSSTPKVLFPAFTPVDYSAITIDGTALGAHHPGRYTQVSSAGKTQITASKLSGGSAFTTRFVSG